MTTLFLFSGQGSQYYQMGLALYRDEPLFRHWLERLDLVAEELLGESIITLLYQEDRGIADPFIRTRYSHPALFMVQYALARTVLDKGVEPDLLLGTSLGEYVALAVAGMVDPEEFLALLINQAEQLEQRCRPGAMLAVLDDPALYQENRLLREKSTLVGSSCDNHFVLSGERQSLTEIAAWLTERETLHLQLPVEFGFHSANIDPVADLFRAASFVPRPATYPILSTLSGRHLTAPAVEGEYLWAIARQPIRFREALDRLAETTNDRLTLIDFGPGGSSAAFAARHQAFTGRTRQTRRTELYRLITPFAGASPDFPRLFSEHAGQSRRRPTMRATLFPGQGSQYQGMGDGLFDRYPEHCREADSILGYSIARLCLENPDNRLSQTRYTQPALFVVNALSWLDRQATGSPPPAYVAGHSLGEYNALFAAGVVDFATGLRLVQRRGELMAAAADGGMAAVIGMAEEEIADLLAASQFQRISIANSNSPVQVVLSGDRQEIADAEALFTRENCRYIILNVSGAFHSPFMAAAADSFRQFLAGCTFSPARLPVIANCTARPYLPGEERQLLARQMVEPVRWLESIRYLWGQGVDQFEEVGPGQVLTGLVAAIKAGATPLTLSGPTERSGSAPTSPPPPTAMATQTTGKPLTAQSLGCQRFKRLFGLDYAYLAGGMGWGISSADLVCQLGRAGMLGFFGCAGLTPVEVERAIDTIQAGLSPGQPYGMNLLAGTDEAGLVELFLRRGVTSIEAAGYVQISAALVKFKLCGLSRQEDGSPLRRHRLLAKLSRPEVAEAFLAPAPAAMVAALLAAGEVSAEQAELAARLPMADAICVVADSAGLTDRGSLPALLPAITTLRDRLRQKYGYHDRIAIGAAGGIGTPAAAAAAFVLGADFILTGSINQCTVEAGTSTLVKEMLQGMNVQDTGYAPAGGRFDFGSKVQVLKKGLFFPARANKLYELYRFYPSLADIDEKNRQELEKRYFLRPLDEIAAEVRGALSPAERAALSPRQEMAAVFQWYFDHSWQLALAGDETERVNFQISCGPALGAFNQWVRGTAAESWQNRPVAAIGRHLLTATAELLNRRFSEMYQPPPAMP